MASLRQILMFFVLVFCFLLLCAPHHTNSHPLKICKLDVMYQRRDTFSGNNDRDFIRQVPVIHPKFGRFNQICLDEKDCTGKVEHAFFMAGEVGGNYYNDAILQGRTTEELRSMVPDVVDLTMESARRLINSGATRVVIPGNLPIGCFPIYQTMFSSNISSAYDENKCVKHLNDFTVYHNEQLQEGINKLVEEHPHTIVVYADYYEAYQYLLRYPRYQGLEKEKACCGIGGKYNFNMTRKCGSRDVPICSDPDRYISWDGINLTRRSLQIMSRRLLYKIFPKLHCSF